MKAPKWLTQRITKDDFELIRNSRYYDGRNHHEDRKKLPRHLHGLSGRALMCIQCAIEYTEFRIHYEPTWREVIDITDNRKLVLQWKNIGRKTINEMSKHFKRHGVKWLRKKICPSCGQTLSDNKRNEEASLT